MGIVSLDFKSAFDNVAREYLNVTLHKHRFSDRMIGRIKSIYEQAQSTAQINGFLSKPIPLKPTFWQRCPLSIYLFTLCLNPLINSLNATLTGIKIGRRQKTVVSAYADDISILLTIPDDIPRLQTILTNYELVSGAKINKAKSKVLALRKWDKNTSVLDTPYHEKIPILSLLFTDRVQRSSTESWNRTTATIHTRTPICESVVFSSGIHSQKRV